MFDYDSCIPQTIHTWISLTKNLKETNEAEVVKLEFLVGEIQPKKLLEGDYS